jgi:U2 small nuclear ribonucleoprotein A'
MIKRLTADLINQAPQYLNPLREREIDLRGNKISVIENLGATQDQFNSIDLSDNEIQKLENFPLLPKLKMLLLSNNRLARIAPGLGEHIPNIDTLILSNNKIESLSELDNLESFKKIKMLSLLGNPVTQKPNYRLYLIAKLPGLKVIDFRKVKPREKAEAREVFGVGKKGAQPKEKAESKVFVPGQPTEAELQAEKAKHAEQIRAAIQNATTLEEVQALERSLQEGKLPTSTTTTSTTTTTDNMEEAV